jgi:hypothetical protein
MAVSGMPEATKVCPDCAQTLTYNAGTRSYLHTLALGCPAFGATWRNSETEPRT